MKGFLTWFKSSTRLKRWMIVILIGIVLACYGFAHILVLDEMSFVEVGKIIALFVVGFSMVIIGLIYMQKRTLEVLIEADVEKELVDIQSLIFNKDVYDKGPKVVVIGGGTGMNTVLQGIKKYTNNITAIVNVSDSEKLLTNERQQMNDLKAEDIRDSLVALADDEILMEKLLKYTFANDRLRGFSFGDIYLSVMKNIYGNVAESIEASGKVLSIVGKILPVTLDKVNISAELKNGVIIEDRRRIAEVMWEKVSPIQRVYVTPSNARPAPGVLEAIADADAVILGPGSLYTNVIPNLLIKGVSKAIKESDAIKIYVANIMTEPGQTDDYTVTDHIDAIFEHVGKGLIDFCICDTGELTPEFIKKYNLDGADLVEQDIRKANERGIHVIKKDLSMVKGEYVRHDPAMLASTIVDIICNDLKFKDKQNEEQYILLNSTQKDVKKQEKEKTKSKKIMEKIIRKEQTKVESNKKESKFSKKYKERIDAIKGSEDSKVTNMKIYESKMLNMDEILEEKETQKEDKKDKIKKETQKDDKKDKIKKEIQKDDKKNKIKQEKEIDKKAKKIIQEKNKAKRIVEKEENKKQKHKK